MSFAVVHVQKFKSSAVKGIQVHNQREKESKTNSDIDKDKSRLNYDLHNQQPVNYTQRVKEIISENVITYKAIRKDAVVMCNVLVTSDHDFFKNMSAADTKKFFEKSYEFFKDRYGEQKIVAAPVHLDEKTPHMHISVVPATDDHRLSAKTMFDRNELRSLQDDYPKFMQEQGFDVQRGIDAEGKNKHVEMQKFKSQSLQNEIKGFEMEINSLKNDLNDLSRDFDKLKDVKVDIDEIDQISVNKAMFNRNLMISPEDLEELKKKVKGSIVKIKDLDKKTDILTQENRELTKAVDHYSKKDMNRKHQQLQDKDEFIKIGNTLDKALDFLDKIDKIDEFKEFEKQKKQMEIVKKMDMEI